MSLFKGDFRQPFIHITEGDTIGTPCVWLDHDYIDHHKLIHDELFPRSRKVEMGHYNPVIEYKSSGFLGINQMEIEYYPITIGDSRILEHFKFQTRIPNNLAGEVFQKLSVQLGLYKYRIENQAQQNKYSRNKMGLIYISHTSWILKAAMKTEDYIQNPAWWNKRTLWQNFISFKK